jgi:hypothetical protein
VCIDGHCAAQSDAGGGSTDTGLPSDASDSALGVPDGGMEMDAFVDYDAGPPPADASWDPFGDSDGDGISDFHEGRASDRDTDVDGTPDYLDPDADNDGIPDSTEAGDMDVATPPIDTDHDGQPDFVDLDSDANGVDDWIELAADRDGDGRPDFRDTDNDGDGIPDTTEIGPDPFHPIDTTRDGVPNYDTNDSDGDTITDTEEATFDTDADGTVDMFDLDTDNDGWTDAVEAGDADLTTLAVDTDSDGDGLSDASERMYGTSRTNPDTDGDGVTDLIEIGAGTRALDPTDNPRTRGNFVFLEPYMMPPSPTRDVLQFSTALQRADVYFLMDNTASMGGTISALQSGLTSTVIPSITSSIPDAWFGVGGFDDYPLGGNGLNPCGSTGYGTNAPDSAGIRHDVPYFQYQIMTSSAAAAQTAVNRYQVNCGEDGPEAGVAALYGLAARDNLSGYARFATGTSASASVPTCPAGYRGSACFRPDAVPIVIIMTDVDQHNSPTCDPSFWGTCTYPAVPGGGPSYASAITALGALNARVVAIETATYADVFLRRLVQDTTIARGAPGVAGDYVVSAPSGSGLTSAITTLVRRAAQVPLDVSAQAVDIADPGETIDAVAAFLDHLEPRLTPATGLTCTTGFSTLDRVGIDLDSYPDTFHAVTPGTPVCFDVVPKQNNTVMQTLVPQLFRARINVIGDGFTPLDNRIIYFLVPPRVPLPNETP